MDDKVNHTLVGGFVLVLGTALVAGVLWLAAGLGAQRPQDAYQATIEESVAGLNVDAPVKYLGVDVGKVSRIQIDPGNSQQVRLAFLIDRGTPIKQDSAAVLKTQGLTGIAYVELSGGSAGSPPLVATADGVPPSIRFKPSLSARLENVLTNVLANVDRVSNNLNAVFDADNRAALKSTLADTATVARALAAQQGALQAGIADAAATARLARATAQQMAPTLARIASSAAALERMAVSGDSAALRVGRAADVAASGVQQLGDESLPDLARLMGDIGRLSAALQALAEQTAASPNSLLLGRPVPSPGPGETTPP